MNDVSAAIHVLTRSRLFAGDLDYHLMRASMVIMFFFFGYQKWFDYEAQVLIPYISNGPLISWLYPVFGVRGASWFLGVAEWTFGLLILLGYWNKRLGILGALGSLITFLSTVTIIPFMPNGWEASAGGFPAMAGNTTFLMKDVVLLAVSFYLVNQDVDRVSQSPGLSRIWGALGLGRKDIDYFVLRASMVIIFLFFGYTKWFEYSSKILYPYISHGPLIFWLYPVFGIRGATRFLGASEWLTCALLFAGFWNKRIGALGALLSTFTFISTVTIIPFFPDGWAASAGGFPAMKGDVAFLMKDVVLLAVSLYLFKQDVVRTQVPFGRPDLAVQQPTRV
jgi:uncharacterized membrane protein YkgB